MYGDWNGWVGGEKPVADSAFVKALLANGVQIEGTAAALTKHASVLNKADCWASRGPHSVVAYQVYEPDEDDAEAA